ncbi:hypothetical protein HOD29_05615 [archaeon]|jgi:tRNA-uridine 2-sulfurtransferase|nr:hypothetical protein [archaeon]
MNKKSLVLFSGGLDSRLAAKIMEEQGFEVHLCFVKLPFGGGCCNNLPCIFNFSQTSGFKLHIVDSTKGESMKEYVELVKSPKYGRGAAMNPCKDCKIFIFKEGKKLADEIGAEVIVTGEVLGQRPMSQMKKALLFDEEIAGLKGKILRPLSAKLLPITDYEKEGLVDREKFFEIHGRNRKKQMALAEEYKIKYPTPGGGCLLCEKDYSCRLKCLLSFNSSPSFEEILFLNNARMFKDKGLIFVGRNSAENDLIEKAGKELGWEILKDEEVPGPSIVFSSEEDCELAKKLMVAYRKDSLDKRKELEGFVV